MSKAPAYAEAPLNHLVAGLERQAGRPVRVQWDMGPLGEPRASLEIQMSGRDYHRVAYLTIRERGAAATYSVVLPGDPGSPQRFAALATALRALRNAAIKALKKRSLEVARVTPDAPSSPHGAKATYTAAAAISHPAIRAAILAGQRITESTGRQPDAGLLMAVVNAALPAVALIEESYRPVAVKGDAEGAAWTERVLVGMLTGALNAAQGDLEGAPGVDTILTHSDPGP